MKGRLKIVFIKQNTIFIYYDLGNFDVKPEQLQQIFVGGRDQNSFRNQNELIHRPSYLIIK
jgi:hypothetical protein